MTTGSCTRSTMTGWWSWSWTPAIVGRSTVSALAGGSELIRGLDHEATRHAGRTVLFPHRTWPATITWTTCACRRNHGPFGYVVQCKT